MAGGPYNIPRNTKGEGRFLTIFSGKALAYTIAFGIIGAILGYMIQIIFPKQGAIKVILALIFGGIGFVITSFKIPESNNFELTRKAGRRIYRPNNFKIY